MESILGSPCFGEVSYICIHTYVYIYKDTHVQESRKRRAAPVRLADSGTLLGV